jgi:hypothetical protein
MTITDLRDQTDHDPVGPKPVPALNVLRSTAA